MPTCTPALVKRGTRLKTRSLSFKRAPLKARVRPRARLVRVYTRHKDAAQKLLRDFTAPQAAPLAKKHMCGDDHDAPRRAAVSTVAFATAVRASTLFLAAAKPAAQPATDERAPFADSAPCAAGACPLRST